MQVQSTLSDDINNSTNQKTQIYNISPTSLSQEIIRNDQIILLELNKLRDELLKYNLASPDTLELETGFILEKINNIREQLGIT